MSRLVYALTILAALSASRADAALYNVHFEGSVWFSSAGVPITPDSRWSADFLIDSTPSYVGTDTISYFTTGVIYIDGYTIYADRDHFSNGVYAYASDNQCCVAGQENFIMFSADIGKQKLADLYYVKGLTFNIAAQREELFAPGEIGIEYWQDRDLAGLPWHQMYISYALLPNATGSTTFTHTFIDSMSITEVPLPAAGLLFAAAMSGLFACRRRA